MANSQTRPIGSQGLMESLCIEHQFTASVKNTGTGELSGDEENDD